MDIRDIWDVAYLHRRRAVPAAVALALAVVTFVLFRSLVLGDDPVEAPPPPAAPPVAAETTPPPPEPEPSAEVAEPEEPSAYPTLLVAKLPIAAGAVLGGEHVEWREWRDDIDLGTVIPQDARFAGQVVGSIARVNYPAGAPIRQGGIVVRGGPGFIGSMLTAGMRAVTVEADGATTRAGIIQPGDRVDVILVSTGAEMLAQTIVRDVRVLGVGSVLAAGSPFGAPSRALGGIADVLGSAGEMASGLVPNAAERGDTFTLEVSAADADRVALAVNFGQITLAMRGIAASAPDSLASTPVGLDDILATPAKVALPPVRIIRGAGSATPAPTPPTPSLASVFGS
ncbi:MAG: Flp pilus assembly protein CpaB [Rhodospirillales bacterium]|nr:Flp pilus assembly protein CpaB [Rhodospirillales bacterium]